MIAQPLFREGVINLEELGRRLEVVLAGCHTVTVPGDEWFDDDDEVEIEVIDDDARELLEQLQRDVDAELIRTCGQQKATPPRELEILDGRRPCPKCGARAALVAAAADAEAPLDVRATVVDRVAVGLLVVIVGVLLLGQAARLVPVVGQWLVHLGAAR